jgi:hypothetical protein
MISCANIQRALSIASFCFAFLMAAPVFVHAQEVRVTPPPQPMLEKGRARHTPGPDKTPIPFTAQDFLRLTADPPRTTIYLGEPFAVTLRLVNHTQFETHILTNFNPRGSLEVHIRPKGSARRRYFGPYPQGKYTDGEFPLYPMEEMPFQVMIWSDPEKPNVLAFPTPGEYEVEIGLLNAGAQLAFSQGPLKLLGPDLRPMPPFKVTVLPPPMLPPDSKAPEASWAPMLKELIDLKAFPHMQLKKIRGEGIPPGLPEKLRELVDRYPATPYSPYVDYCVAIDAWGKAGPNAADDQWFALASNYYQRAAAADSAYRDDALYELVRLYDNRGMPELAKQAAINLIEYATPLMKTIYGAQPFVRKYLINTAEISPNAYWNILDDSASPPKQAN